MVLQAHTRTVCCRRTPAAGANKDTNGCQQPCSQMTTQSLSTTLAAGLVNNLSCGIGVAPRLAVFRGDCQGLAGRSAKRPGGFHASDGLDRPNCNLAKD